MAEKNIESLLQENRTFNPSESFAKNAHIKSREEYDRYRKEALENPEGFWAGIANELHWYKKWDTVLNWNIPYAKWFEGGKINACYNCVDRHLETKGDKPAIVFEGEPGDRRTLTFNDLHKEVCQFANALEAQGVQAGDRVGIYMPMIAEAVVAMLACARIGAVHSVVFGGFSAEALRGRMIDAEAKAVITADGGWRRGKIVPLKANVDEALNGVDCVKSVIVYQRCKNDVTMQDGRDVWWHEITKDASTEHKAAELDSEHPLFTLYTSGTTGKPKGILHTTAGYLTGTMLSSRWVFDLKEDDVYWCTADIGWITGHSYVVYGILANGVTCVVYEGAPNHPNPDRFWEIVDQHKVTVFYTAPTAIRAFMKWGDEWPEKHNLSSLRLLGTVGEPINPEAWIWYHTKIGHENCPIVDTWWQTETGAIMITPLPGFVATKPGSATLPLPWVDAAIVDKEGKEVPRNQGGFLVVRKPWPSMLRTIYKDSARYEAQYWNEIPGMYFAGDSSRQDEDGYFWIMGRVDDVLNVSGHRIGTMEVESALVSHTKVAEAAVVGMPDPVKGQAIAAFVTLAGNLQGNDELVAELRQHVAKEIGALAKPEFIRFADGLPKTRSGKIMRRLLKSIAAGEEIAGDTTTLEDPKVLAQLQGKPSNA